MQDVDPAKRVRAKQDGSDGRLRTCNLLGNSEALCRLSYIGMIGAAGRSRTCNGHGLSVLCLPFHHGRKSLVGADGIEPPRAGCRPAALPLSYAP